MVVYLWNNALPNEKGLISDEDKAAIKAINDNFKLGPNEQGGYIYKKNGKYYYTVSHEHNEKGYIILNGGVAKLGGVSQSYWHTHPYYKHYHDGEWHYNMPEAFSLQDLATIDKSKKLKTVYVGTPSGKIWAYSPTLIPKNSYGPVYNPVERKVILMSHIKRIQ